ncbi:MAG: polyprenyl synthetase family protein [Candidatus Aenigmatarchaeota archaeon]
MGAIEDYLKETSVVVNRKIEEWIPRKYGKSALAQTFGKPSYEYCEEAMNECFAKPFWDLLDRGGKRWRPALMLLIAEALGKDQKGILDFVVIPEVVHNGTLMVDDIEDRSDLRRGKACTYKLFGTDVAINTGNMMYFLPMAVLMRNEKKIGAEKTNGIFEAWTQEMINLSYGQAMDIAWHNQLCDDNVSEAQYLQMCAFKTGTLARMAAKIGAILAGADSRIVEKVGKFAESVGIAFQIQDDILNIAPSEGWGKEFGEDIKEGKMTLMVIHTLKKASARDRERLMKILGEHTSDRKKLAEAMGIIKASGAVEYAKEFSRKLVKASWDDVESNLKESKAKSLLKEFAYFLIERKI